MLFLKSLMLTCAAGLFMTMVLVAVFDAQRVVKLSRTMSPDAWPGPRPLRWRKAARLVVLGCLVMLPALTLIARTAELDAKTAPVRRVQERPIWMAQTSDHQ
jgi:hypothetical protein